MDRKVQRFFTLLLVFFISKLGYSQCPKDVIQIISDTVETNKDVFICKKVKMSPDKFAYYYQIEKNLKAIEDSIPSLAKNIEKERAKSDSVKANLEMTVEISNRQKELLRFSLDDCVETATELEIHNLYLQESLEQEKKKGWIKGGMGVVLGIIIKGLL